ncbi:ATP-dependent helicase [Nocardioides halotolerans]|uniref:ATP-dependent helicase n=1 Tax=Nocardioides halotolerans TaxID=433660 RepID=UPI00040CEC4A|nr:ATP-dependent DNA helicase [Nocardioides halotolerans]
MTETATTYHLVRPSLTVETPVLDEQQQRVVYHDAGPLLVLAGPGTGKTTTLVEAIVRRIDEGVHPDQILALTFSRKAAEQLRDRVSARVGRTMSASIGSTFHSFAYGLIRRYAPAQLYVGPLRLLSAPEQDVVLRELLQDHPESVRWPESLRVALGTRGFAGEVHAVLSRAREKGLDGDQLAELGEREGLPELVAAGAFLEQYLTILDDRGAVDYADLIRRATIEATVHRDELRGTYAHVFVDEYQDTDSGQVALLRALAGDGRNLVAVGDPHQSIYAFRGAEVRGILDFATEFPQADGSPAEVVALGTTRRFGPRILTAAQRVAERIGLPGAIPEQARTAFLEPRAVAGDHGDGRVTVRTFDSDRAEAEHLADLLRRAHLEDGIAWDEMAVLVRSGRASIQPLRRSLGAAGVPVEVASDEVPLVRDPAALPLIDAMRVVLNLDNADVDHPDHIDAARAEALLTGPLGGLDAGDVRRLARQLRQREKAAAAAEERPPVHSRELVRLAVLAPSLLDGLEGPEVDRARAVAGLVARTRAQLDEGASAEELLWTLWSGTSWPTRLRRSVELGGGAARRAHRDLDSICALFEAAARAEETRDRVGAREFLATLVAQQIPADTLAERGARGAAVRLLTAHRAKGLEWRLVVVAHVQQDGWPDLRRRSTLLGADRIGTDGLVPATTAREMLTEERRLFYVACTRARERLVVTAVASPEDDGDQPSRFLQELGVSIEVVEGRPARTLSLGGLVSELRRTAADPAVSPALRQAAARRLARLAAETTGDRALVPMADPSTWWGTRAATRSVRPLRDPDQPVPVSASLLDAITTCPTQWFLAREAGGVTRSHQSANLGEIVHALAQRIAAGELDVTPDEAGVEALMQHVGAVWDRMEFRTPWARARELERTRAALGRFLSWHTANARTVIGIEQEFRAVVDLPDGERIRLAGYADRLELDADGRVVVVDLKTTRSKPTDKSLATNVQLGLYQLAVDQGAIDGLPGLPEGRAEAGGAELVQLGLRDGGPDAVVQTQGAQADDGPERTALRGQLARAAQLLRAEQFPAIVGDQCRECPFEPICPAKSAGHVVAQ